MGLFNIFKGKDPLQHEQQGDTHFEAGAFGQAKIEYESALEKRHKTSPDDTDSIGRLQEKIHRSKEALSREHKHSGDDLSEAGYFEDAREYYTLALDLTQDPSLTGELQNSLQNIQKRQAEQFHDELPDIDEPEAQVEAQTAPETGDEYFTALCSTLPDDIRKAYLDYGRSFKNGFMALNQGDFETAAEELARALEENPAPDNFIRLELATAYLNLERLEEARALLEEFLTHHPDTLPAYQLLCEIFWETGSFDRAQALLESLSDDLQESLATYLLRGETLFRAGKYPQAKSFYQDFLSNYGWNEHIARALAGTYEAMGDLEKARGLYGEIMGQCSSCGARIDPLIKRKYADLSMATGQQTEKVLEIYLSLVSQDPANAAQYYHQVSQIYATLGNEKESRRFQFLAQRYARNESSAEESN
jgi:tetratricopeptide (TPR) repeat protein